MKRLCLAFFFLGALAHFSHAQNGVRVPADGAQVHLTIAQQEQSLVSDRRTITLPAGHSLVLFTQVPEKVDVTAVQPLISGPAPVEILEQRFGGAFRASETDVLSRYIGQTVTLLRTGETSVKGTLLSVEGVLLLDTAEGLMVNPRGTFLVPRAADGLVTATPPALVWLVNVATAGQYTVEARYATTGLSWRANYSASFNTAGDRLTLHGWLNVDNQSGVAFQAAQIALQPGKINEAEPLLKYPRPVDLPRFRSQQLSLVAVKDLPVTPELQFYAAAVQANFMEPYNASPQIVVRLRNSAEAGLGVPLPAGPLAVWSVASDETLQSLSQHILPFTEVNEPMRISLGAAPKVGASRAIVATRQLNPQTVEHTVKIELSNSRAEPVTVSVLELLPTGSKITESDIKPVNAAANPVEWKVVVPAGDTAEVNYVIEVKS